MEKLKKLISTIVLSLICAGLWDLLRPLFVFIYEHIVLYLLQLFSDSFYASVAKSVDSPQASLYFSVFIIFACSFLFPISQTFDWYRDRSKQYKALLRGFIFGTSLFFAFSGALENQIARDTLRNIEIIAPYVSDSEYKTLKSDFYRMKSKNEYIDLMDRIDAIMDENNLSE